MADRPVLLAVLFLLLTVPCGVACWLVWLLLRRLVPATTHLAHTAPERAAAWVLVAVTAAGPADADPDTYASRAAALPLLTTEDTTTGGPR